MMGMPCGMKASSVIFIVDNVNTRDISKLIYKFMVIYKVASLLAQKIIAIAKFFGIWPYFLNY